MRSNPRLGLVNFALVSAYFVPVWGHDALRVLTSPYNGFEDSVHAAAAVYFRDVFDLGLVGLIRMSGMLAGLKMVIAAAFVAYLIEFARALVMRREPDRATVDVVLLLALAVAITWILPTLTLGDAGLVRLQASQFLLLVGAAIVIMIERHIERSAQTRATRSTAVARERETQSAVAAGSLHGVREWGLVSAVLAIMAARRMNPTGIGTIDPDFAGTLRRRLMPRW